MTDEMSRDELRSMVDDLQRGMNRIHRHMGQVEAQGLDGRTLYWDLSRMHEEVVHAVKRLNAHARAVETRVTEEKEATPNRYEYGDIVYTHPNRNDVKREPLAHLAPGVFVYSGFGVGHLHLPEGRIAWRRTTEARQICQEQALTFVYVDPVHTSMSGPSVSPRHYRIGNGPCVNCGSENPTPACTFCGRLYKCDEKREERAKRAKREVAAARKRDENMADDFEEVTCHDELSDCECDSTHGDNGTVCRWCYAHGRRKPTDQSYSCEDCGGCTRFSVQHISLDEQPSREGGVSGDECERCGRRLTEDDVGGGRCLECGMTIMPLVHCKFCGREVPQATAHRHRDAWVGDECCWDERLRVTE